jgi:hypothetical protein
MISMFSGVLGQGYWVRGHSFKGWIHFENSRFLSIMPSVLGIAPAARSIGAN